MITSIEQHTIRDPFHQQFNNTSVVAQETHQLTPVHDNRHLLTKWLAKKDDSDDRSAKHSLASEAILP
jgi:hypothetical protein